jgi:uncharacterized protein
MEWVAIMLSSLKKILSLQELDVKLIRLMTLKNERKKELDHIHSLRNDLHNKLEAKEQEILELKKELRILEGKVAEIKERIEKLEGQQNQVKKVDEFNALSQEISQTERARNNAEQNCSDLIDTLSMEEDGLESIKESIQSSEESSQIFEQELKESILRINEEGRELQKNRDTIATNISSDIDNEVMAIYQKLLSNKRDRVVVPVENRTCSGCHIVLTAQHENLIRRGERITFCEHCSRILYWPESEMLQESEEAPKKRRRRRTSAL